MDRQSGPARRILILNERDPKHPKAGGAEIHVSEIFGRLARRGSEVHQLSSGFEGGASREVVNDVQVHRLGSLLAYYPRVPIEVASMTRSGGFEVVVECLNKMPFYSPVYSRAPVLGLVHHLFGEVAFQQKAWPIAAAVWTAERFIPMLYRRCEFLAISESSGNDLVRRGIEATRIRVSHPGIDEPSVPVDVSSPRSCQVAYLGRLESYKRIDVLLRAMAQLGDRFPDAQILIIGRGDAEAGLRKLAAKLGLADRVRFTGFVSNLERDALLADCRVCVCPSEKEGWGLTVIESNAVGTPNVATDTDGLRDSVRDGETGFLVPDGDISAFAERIGELLGDEERRQRMSEAALRWSKRFGWDTAADEMASAIADSIGGR